MILTCPACGTQYVVKDGAIPEGGRKVRCASCKHSWHQDPPLLELEDPLEPTEPQAPAESYDPAEPHAPEPAAEEYAPAGDASDEGYVEQGYADDGYFEAPAASSPGHEEENREPLDYVPAEPIDEAPEQRDEDFVPVPGSEFAELEPPSEPVDDDFSPFAVREPAERKRRSPIVAVLLVIVLVAALAAIFWFLAPAEWKARVGLAEGAQTPLQLMMTHSDRQALESGNELLAVSGRVINPTTKAQRVPPIQAELRSKAGEVVYRWTIAPPTATLAPGASARFNSAEVNVPAGGEELTVSLGAPGA